MSPLLFVVFHAYLLLTLKLLADNIDRYNDVVKAERAAGQYGSADDMVEDNFRLLLPNFAFVQLVGGPTRARTGAIGLVLKAMVWITVVIGPVLLLLFMQLKFLPYHDPWVTWWHRGLLFTDLVLLWFFWPYITLSDGRARFTIERGIGLALCALIVTFAVLIATFQVKLKIRTH